jgi:cytochrome P450
VTVAPGALDDLLTAPEFFANPWPVYDRLLEEAPVYYSVALRAWLVSRYVDAEGVLRDIERFPNSIRIPRFLEQLGPDVQAEIGGLKHHFSVGLVQSDPPDHTRIRALVHREFQPRAVARQRDHIQELVDGLLDRVASTGRMDLVADFAYPLPVTVISDMVGIPSADRTRYKAWSDGIFGFIGSGRPSLAAARAAQGALDELEAYFRGLFGTALSAPERNLIGHLVALHTQDPERLREDELLAMCSTFVSAGHETTTSLIANGMLALLAHPEEVAKLRDHPELIASAVEEILRFASPFQRDMKVAAVEVEIAGQQVRAGEQVWVMLGAAHRDPQRFPDPERFDIERSDVRHLAFGYGPHFCLGAWLARLEGQIALGTLIRRLPDLRLVTDADAIEWRPDYALRTPRAIPVAF